MGLHLQFGGHLCLNTTFIGCGKPCGGTAADPVTKVIISGSVTGAVSKYKKEDIWIHSITFPSKESHTNQSTVKHVSRNCMQYKKKSHKNNRIL